MRARLLLWAERLLVGAGTLALIWCAATAGDALLAQRAARGSFEAARLAARALAPPPRAGSATRPTAGRLSAGDAIAALSMPRIGLSAIVLHGSDERTLRRGPGHLEYTPLPGQPGNVVIAGHRDSHFWPLRNVRLGDDVFVDTAGGRFRYQVSALRVVPPHEVSVLAPTTDDVLTLITCYPFWVWGNAPDRLIVRARRVEIGTAAAAVASPPLEGAGSPLSAVVSMRDEDRVRDALERFRLAYNARAGASLRFDACEISTAAEQATATCIARGAAASARTFSLARTAGGWIITSVALRWRDRRAAVPGRDRPARRLVPARRARQPEPTRLEMQQQIVAAKAAEGLEEPGQDTDATRRLQPGRVRGGQDDGRHRASPLEFASRQGRFHD